MNDAAWCRAVLDRLDDRLLAWTQFVGQFSRELDETQVAWNDTAAREVFDRYLIPHRQDVEATLMLLRQQLALLRAVVGQMVAADVPAAEIQLLSIQAAGLRQQAENQVCNAHRHVDLALNDASSARHRSDQARQVLATIA